MLLTYPLFLKTCKVNFWNSGNQCLEIILQYFQVFHDHERVLNKTRYMPQIQLIKLHFWTESIPLKKRSNDFSAVGLGRPTQRKRIWEQAGPSQTLQSRSIWGPHTLRNHMNKLVSPSPLPFPPTHMRIPQRRSLIYLSLDERRRLFLNNQSFKRTACIVVHFKVIPN